MAGKNVSEITYFVSVGLKTSTRQSNDDVSGWFSLVGVSGFCFLRFFDTLLGWQEGNAACDKLVPRIRGGYLLD